MKQIEKPNIDQNKLRMPDHVEAILDCGHMTVHQVLGKMSREVNASADEVNEATKWVNEAGDTLAENEKERILTFDEFMQDAKEELEEAISEAGSKDIVDYSVTKKKLAPEVTGILDDLQSQIDQLVVGGLTLNFTVTSPVFVGEESSITASATSNVNCEKITINGGNLSQPTKTNATNYSVNDTLTPSVAGNTQYTAKFIIKGVERTKTANVTAVNKIYYGGASGYASLVTDAHSVGRPKTSAAGDYVVSVPENGMKIFFIVPATMSINKALIDNNPLGEIPLSASSKTIDGVGYKIYESANTVDAGTYNITIS